MCILKTDDIKSMVQVKTKITAKLFVHTICIKTDDLKNMS